MYISIKEKDLVWATAGNPYPHADNTVNFTSFMANVKKHHGNEERLSVTTNQN